MNKMKPFRFSLSKTACTLCYQQRSNSTYYSTHIHSRQFSSLLCESLEDVEVVEKMSLKSNSLFGNSLESSPTLVLNADYTPLTYYPLSLWSWKDSIRAVLSEKATVVSEYPTVKIRTIRNTYSLPSVIALKQYQRGFEDVPALTRRLLYIRDDFQCQVSVCSRNPFVSY